MRQPQMRSRASDIRRIDSAVPQGAAGSDILGKAVKFLIDGGAVREFGKVCREFLDSFALVCIGNANLELRQTAQRVDLIDDHFGQTIDADGVARNDSVKPAGTARATGIGAEFTAGIADVVAGFVKQFSREIRPCRRGWYSF